MARITLSPPSKKTPASKKRSRAKKIPASASTPKKASVPKKTSQIKHKTPEPKDIDDDTNQLVHGVENEDTNEENNEEINLTTNTSLNSDQDALDMETLNLNTPPSNNKTKKRKISTKISAKLTTLPSQTNDQDTSPKETTPANDIISSSNTKKRKFSTPSPTPSPVSLPKTTSTPIHTPRKPASQAKKCPRCGGIHRSTCESNMERIDSINDQLGVIWTYTRAMGVLDDEICCSTSSPSSSSSFNLSPSSPSSCSCFPLTSSEGGEGEITKVENEAKSQAQAKEALKLLYAEATQWAEKSRRLLLEVAMREGDMEEGERLRGLIRRSKCSNGGEGVMG